jgi:5-methylcytosine-specific restriction protein A
MDDCTDFFMPADDEHIRREKTKAREMRRSQWWKNQMARGQCHYCRCRFHPSELTMDHVVPIARGGHSTKSNVVPACKECNSRKKYLLPVEWQEYLDALARRSRDGQ